MWFCWNTLYWMGNPSPAYNLQSYRVLRDKEDSEYEAKIARIQTVPTGWKIGRSNQNNCTNVHISGSIVAFPGSTFLPDPSSINGGYIQLGNELFDTIVDLNREFTFLDMGYYSSGQYRYHKKICFANIFVEDAAVMLNTFDYTTSWRDGEDEPPFPTDQKYYWSYGTRWYPTYYTQGVGPLPCSKSVQLGYEGRCEVHLDFMAETGFVPVKPDVEYFRTDDYFNYIRRYYSYGCSRVETEVIFPPCTQDPWVIKFKDNKYDLDAAMAEALSSQVDFTTSNGIAYGLDAKDIVSSAKGDLEGLKALAKGAPGKLKIASKLFLSVHYGWKLMAADTLEFSKAFQEFSKNSTRRVHYSTTGSSQGQRRGGFTLQKSVAHCSIYYDPYAQIASETLKLAEAMDVVPDLSNVWDMIPFSFVVDWFTNIGELAEGVDALFTLAQEHKVLGTIQSTKEVYEYHADNGIGSYKYTFYDRSCIQDWYPIPKFSFQLKNPITNLTHWCEAGALVVATRP